MKSRKEKVRIRVLLEEIAQRVEKIEKLDLYGDLIENFEDSDGTRITRRLIDMINNDLSS